MNRKTLLTTIGIGLVVLALGFVSGKAIASTGCFTDTNGHWAEVYICWLKDNGIASGYGDGTFGPENNIKRSEMAVMLRRQAEVPPTTGLIAVSEGNGNWKPFTSTSDLIITYLPGYTLFGSPANGSDYIVMNPSIPTVLYGNRLQFISVEFCFSASTSNYLDTFEVFVTTNSNGTGTTNVQLSDTTNRTAPACRYYMLSSPVTLSVENEISVRAYLTFTNLMQGFIAGRTTFYFLPTGTKAVLPTSLEDATVLSEGASPEDVPSTKP